jgi:hypothetical protein
MTNCVGVDLDAHHENQHPIEAAKRLTGWAMALGVPIVCHRSRSGSGVHVRTVFEKAVPVIKAWQLYYTGLKNANVLTDPSFDKIWPPKNGYGVLALPLNGRAAKENGGSIGVDPVTMKPLPKGAHAVALLEGERMSLADLDFFVGDVELETDEGPRLDLVEGLYNGLEPMLYECCAVRRLEQEATTVPYEFWRGMAASFRVLKGGYQAFWNLSRMDPVRFSQKALDKAWNSKSVVHCENLDRSWVCPRLRECRARGVGRPSYIAKGQRQFEDD